MEKKTPRLNIEAVKKKSARISVRLSNVFRLATQTVDEGFNFEEETISSDREIRQSVSQTRSQFDRSVSSENLRVRVRNSILSSLFRDVLLTQVKIAEDFEELLLGPQDRVRQRIRSIETIRRRKNFGSNS